MNTITPTNIFDGVFVCDEGCGATFPNWDEYEQMLQVEKGDYAKLVCEDCAYELWDEGWTV